MEIIASFKTQVCILSMNLNLKEKIDSQTKSLNTNFWPIFRSKYCFHSKRFDKMKKQIRNVFKYINVMRDAIKSSVVVATIYMPSTLYVLYQFYNQITGF